MLAAILENTTLLPKFEIKPLDSWSMNAFSNLHYICVSKDSNKHVCGLSYGCSHHFAAILAAILDMKLLSLTIFYSKITSILN